MRHSVLSEYLAKVERAVLDCHSAYIERYLEETLTSERVNLRIRLRFNNGSMLEISEAIVVKANELAFLDYRYHFQDENNRLIFRYDSAPHYPEIDGFPYHKHLPCDVIHSVKPDVERMIREAAETSKSG